MPGPHIDSIAWGVFESTRPRHAGSNARLGAHGITIRVPILRLTASDGSSGFGACRAPVEQAATLLGQPLDTLFSAGSGVADAWRAFDYPLWDLVGKRAGQPVYALAAAANGLTPPETLTAPCYDTSLYFDDLDLSDEQEAVELIAEEARQGYARGHRSFKIKVGRGARHLPLETGTRRDIAIIRAVREVAGPDGAIMIDANNGYNLNITKQVLEATADCNLFWLEEAFHEDDVLYRDLRAWMENMGLNTLIADGEGAADPRLLDWARDGIVDVIQYDIFGYGFSRWLALGTQLDGWGRRSAPHHYGGHYGNFAGCHLAGAIQGFTFAEWDEASTPGLDTSGYTIEQGRVRVPSTPGFGIMLDEERFAHAVAAGGYSRAL